MTTLIEQLEPIQRLTRDLKKAATTLSAGEARFLVDAYYSMQDQRIRTNNQIRALSESGEPHSVIAWYAKQSEQLEKSVQRALDAYSNSQPLGQWARSIVGIGPVISAGLLAHIDVTKPTAGHVWAFAGYDPTKAWEKGQKRPWNAALKTLCWKAGESFVKVQSRDGDFYGKLYAERKAFETETNAGGGYADQAKSILSAKRFGKDTEAFGHYTAGHLPPAHIHARAKRYAVKLFLAHYHAIGHFIETGKCPPKPWVIEHGGHAHVIDPPNMDMIEGFATAWQ